MPRKPNADPSSMTHRAAAKVGPAKANAVTPNRSARNRTTAAGPVVPAVIERAQQMGLLSGTQQVGARLPAKLLQQARKRTGIASTTDLLTFALANVAVEDNFANAFIAARGKLDPDLDVGF